MLLNGKRFVVTGVLNDSSIAFGAAKRAQEEGAQIVLTSFGRAMRLTERAARRLPETPDVLELDVTEPTHLEALTSELEGRWGGVDGALHAVAFAPETCLGGGFLDAPWDDVALALQISAHSLAGLARSLRPLMQTAGGSIVGLDFDNSTVAWPVYDWMGVAKAAFESTARYLARELGPEDIRVNLVAAGPLRTIAARSIPGFEQFEEVWSERAPLGWDVRDPDPVARAVVALFSDLFPATTGEVLHVDGGFHAVGA